MIRGLSAKESHVSSQKRIKLLRISDLNCTKVHKSRTPLCLKPPTVTRQVAHSPIWTPSLTHVVPVRGLGRSVLQTRQDLALPHVAVAHQQELEQKVVRPRRAASVAHPRGG